MDNQNSYDESLNQQNKEVLTGMDALAGAVAMLLQETRKRDDTMRELVQLSMNRENAASYQVMPDLTKSIQNFDGEDNARDWLLELEGMKTLHNWPDDFVLEVARGHLVGGAKEWFLMKINVFTTFASFKEAFERTFIRQTTTSEKWKRMQQCVQGRDSLAQYFHLKARLCRDLRLNFADTKEQILEGLRDRNLCTAMMMGTHLDCDDLFVKMSEYCLMDQHRSERYVNAVKDMRPAQPRSGTSAPAASKLPDRVDGKPLCFNCKTYGHVAKYCRKPNTSHRETTVRPTEITCYTCKTPGHTSNHCPIKREATNAVNNGASDHLKIAQIRSQYCTAMIDTGSSVTIISESTAARCGLQTRPTKTAIYAYGKSDVQYSTGEVIIEINIDRASGEVTALVVPTEVQPYDLIIGRDFLDQPQIAYQKISENLSLWNLPDQATPLRTEKDEKVNAHQTNFITVHSNRKTVVVPLINNSDEDVNIEKGEIIASLRDYDGKSVGTITTNVGGEIPEELVSIGPSATNEQREELMATLNEYTSCFALEPSELVCTPLTRMQIETLPGPVCCRPYRASADERTRMAKILKEWRKLGIVEETKSPYASPCLLVKRKDKADRLVVDYRRLNIKTKRRYYPLPLIEDLFEDLGGFNLFCTLDLASGYLQIELTDEAREKCAFVTPDEHLQPTRMMFGLANAPFEFSKLMTLVLAPIKTRGILWYLDDVLVAASNWTEMCQKLKIVFKAIKDANLTFKLDKCHFGAAQVQYVGYTLSKDGLRPNKTKVEAVTEFPEPRNVTELRRFLGLTGYFRRFMQNYASIARPLSNLLKKNATYSFGEPQWNAFCKLKQLLSQSPVLKLHNPNASIVEVHSDASKEGVAAILLEADEEGDPLRPVLYLSKATTEAEKSYHAYKLELLAIVFALMKLRTYLLGKKFTIRTDCQAITHINTQKVVSGQIARWLITLQEFDYSIVHRPGSTMQHADALSRAPIETNEKEISLSEYAEILTLTDDEENLLSFQLTNAKLKVIIMTLLKSEEERTRHEKELTHKYLLEQGKLMRIIDEQETKRYVLPNSMRKAILVRFHDQNGHFGLERTIDALRRKFWFKGIKRYAKMHIRGCVKCLFNKLPSGKKEGLLNLIPTPQRPFARIHLDHCGPLPTSKTGAKHILVLIDAFTRFIQLFAVKDTKTSNTIKCIEKSFRCFGFPKIIITDRGTSFTSEAFQRYCEEKTIKHVLNSPRHPQANGVCERSMKTIIPTLKAHLGENNFDDWSKFLTSTQRELNLAKNATTGFAPYEALFGYMPDFEQDVLDVITGETDSQSREETQIKMRENIAKAEKKYKARYDATKRRPCKYEPGELVLVQRPAVTTGEPTKLQPNFKGPLMVYKALPSDTYVVGDLPTSNKNLRTTAHVSQMRRYLYEDEIEEEDSEASDSSNDENQDEENESAPEEIEHVKDIDSFQEPSDDAPVEDRRPKRTRKTPQHLQDYVKF
jgi:transposase InsO family protein